MPLNLFSALFHTGTHGLASDDILQVPQCWRKGWRLPQHLIKPHRLGSIIGKPHDIAGVNQINLIAVYHPNQRSRQHLEIVSHLDQRRRRNKVRSASTKRMVRRRHDSGIRVTNMFITRKVLETVLPTMFLSYSAQRVPSGLPMVAGITGVFANSS